MLCQLKPDLDLNVLKGKVPSQCYDGCNSLSTDGARKCLERGLERALWFADKQQINFVTFGGPFSGSEGLHGGHISYNIFIH